MAGAERERPILGEKLGANRLRAQTTNGRRDGQGRWNNEVGRDAYIRGAATPLAAEWDGWKVGNSCLKPAYEFVGWFQKPPSEKTLVANVLKHGVGAINARAGAIPYQTEKDFETVSTAVRHAHGSQVYGEYADDNAGPVPYRFSPAGRFPANLLVEGDVLDDGRDYKGFSGGGGGATGIFATGEVLDNYQYYGDSGGFSRFFSLDSWVDKLISRLPPEAQRTFPFMVVPKPAVSEKNRGCEDFFWLDGEQITEELYRHLEQENEEAKAREEKPPHRIQQGNIHTTVKAVKLMCYLLMLATRPGYTVLDPFMGTGTTLMACKALGREGIGIELEERWARIAQARIAATAEIPPALDLGNSDASNPVKSITG